jgi:hypothetical protein
VSNGKKNQQSKPYDGQTPKKTHTHKYWEKTITKKTPKNMKTSTNTLYTTLTLCVCMILFMSHSVCVQGASSSLDEHTGSLSDGVDAMNKQQQQEVLNDANPFYGVLQDSNSVLPRFRERMSNPPPKGGAGGGKPASGGASGGGKTKVDGKPEAPGEKGIVFPSLIKPEEGKETPTSDTPYSWWQDWQNYVQ